MSAETFVNALFLITAVVAAGILITAVLPIIWNMAGTFSTASHESDTRMRTDFKIVTTYAKSSGSGGVAKVWMKDIGSNRIGITEIDQADVIIGLTGNMARAQRVSGVRTTPTNPNPALPGLMDGQWTYNLFDDNDNSFWDTAETLEVDYASSQFTTPGQSINYQFILPNGVWRSSEIITS